MSEQERATAGVAIQQARWKTGLRLTCAAGLGCPLELSLLTLVNIDLLAHHVSHRSLRTYAPNYTPTWLSGSPGMVIASTARANFGAQGGSKVRRLFTTRVPGG